MQEFAAPKPGSLIALVLVVSLGCSPLALAQEGDAEVVVAFADGVRAFNEGRNEDAKKRFRHVIELSNRQPRSSWRSRRAEPRNDTAHYWLGLTLLRLGQPAEALAEIQDSLRKGTNLQVDPLWARHDLGGAQLAAGDAAAAEATLSAVVTEVEARLQQARNDEPRLRSRLKRRLDRLESRLASARNASDKREVEDEIEALAAEGEALLAAQRSDEILLARTLLGRGEALERLGRPEDAAAARARAGALIPDLAGVIAPPWAGDLPLFAASASVWDARVGLTTLGDSNPSLLSESLSLDTPDVGIQLVRGGESDQATELDLQLTFQPKRNRRGWGLGAVVQGRQSFYQNLDFFDVGELRAVVFAAHGGTPMGYLNGPLGAVRTARDGERRVSFLFQGGADHTMLNHSAYLTTAEGSASLLYCPSRRWTGQVDLHLLNRAYHEEPVAGRRSGTEIRLGLSQRLSLGLPDRSLRLEVLAGERSAGLPFESSLLRGTAELSLPFPRAFTLSLRGSWQWDDYANPESDLFFREYDPFNPIFKKLELNPTRRSDTTLRAAGALIWTVWPSLQLAARYAWTDRDTNLDDNLVSRFASLDYRRTIFSLGASWLF